jgi:hypothetical protein
MATVVASAVASKVLFTEEPPSILMVPEVAGDDNFSEWLRA